MAMSSSCHNPWHICEAISSYYISLVYTYGYDLWLVLQVCKQISKYETHDTGVLAYPRHRKEVPANVGTHAEPLFVLRSLSARVSVAGAANAARGARRLV